MTNRTKVYPRRWDDLDRMMEDDEWDDEGWRIEQKLTPEEGMIWLGWWMGWWMMTNRTKVYPWRCDDKWDDGGWRTGHKFTPEEEQQTGADNAEDQFPASKKLFVIIITIPYYWDHRNNLQIPLHIISMKKENSDVERFMIVYHPSFCSKLHWSDPLLICTERFLHILPSMGSDWINLEPAAPIARHWLTTM